MKNFKLTIAICFFFNLNNNILIASDSTKHICKEVDIYQFEYPFDVSGPLGGLGLIGNIPTTLINGAIQLLAIPDALLAEAGMNKFDRENFWASTIMFSWCNAGEIQGALKSLSIMAQNAEEMLLVAPNTASKLSRFRPLASAGQGYTDSGAFLNYIPKKLPPQGWKIHITASPENAYELAKIILPKLRKWGVNHKVIYNIDLYENWMTSGSQRGKFITIYPNSEAHSLELVIKIDRLLIGKNLTGLAVPGELSVGKSGLIFTRYGSFIRDYILNPYTKRIESDIRGLIAPDWVEIPFAPAN